jgi:hypothetical protein
MIKAVWQRVVFGGVYTAKGIAFNRRPNSSNDSDPGCRKAGIYTDDFYHPVLF